MNVIEIRNDLEKQHMCDCDMIHEKIVEDTRGRMQAEEEYLDLASLFKMFGDGTRVKILHALELNEMCVCDLAALLGMTKSAISHQLKILKQNKLVKNRREGKSIFYSLADDHVRTIIAQGQHHINE